MKKPPRQIIAFLEDPEKYERKTFETAIRNEIESNYGNMGASQELLVGLLIIQIETLLDAHKMVLSNGYVSEYSSGQSQSPHIKTRTEALDKIIKILKELAIVNKSNKKNTEVDELFNVS